MTDMKGAFRAALAVAAITATAFGVSPAAAQCGRASWYASHGRMASGERMNPSALVAAHRTLPFGTMVKVENLGNGRSVVVRIADRGPFVRGRVIDVSRGAARQLGFVGAGTAKVRLSVVAAGKATPVGSCG